MYCKYENAVNQKQKVFITIELSDFVDSLSELNIIQNILNKNRTLIRQLIKVKIGDEATVLIKEILRNVEQIESLLSNSEFKKIFEKQFKEYSLFIKKILGHSIFNAKSKFIRALESGDVSKEIHALKYIDDFLSDKMLNTSYYIIRLRKGITLGSAKVPLPKDEVTEVELYGPIRKILDEVKHIVNKWARSVKLNGRVWISGSLLDGVSPIKGLFENSNFVIYKPFDYEHPSDVDIGIGLDRIVYSDEVPPQLQSKDRLSLTNTFGKVVSLSSAATDKVRILHEFKYEYAKKYVKLIELLELIKLRNISLKDRGIHLQFFLIDSEVPESKELKYFQRKFIIYDKFVEPKIKKEEQSLLNKLSLIVEHQLGKDFNPELIVFLHKFIETYGKEYKNTNKYAKEISGKFGLSQKKSEKILRQISNEL